MNKLYQTKYGAKGNCMQTAIASLFESPLDEVPNFIEYESWFPPLHAFLIKRGYELSGELHNKVYSTLISPTNGCFEEVKWYKPSIITPKCLKKHEGINGLFSASVLSPKYFNWRDLCAHSVIIDKDFNIVHDVNQKYQSIKKYPLADILGYNGIINIDLINPAKR